MSSGLNIWGAEYLGIFIVLISFIVIISLLILFTYSIRIHFKIKKEYVKLQEYKINVNTQIDEEIPAILELIINECFLDYCSLNIELSTNEYMNDEMEAKIRGDLTNKVSQRISPTAITKLSLYYNPRAIGEIIADKIYILVMNYVVDYNRIKDESIKLLPNEKIKG